MLGNLSFRQAAYRSFFFDTVNERGVEQLQFCQTTMLILANWSS